jgi:hypothetical protein
LRALGTLFMDGSVVDHLLDGWLCSWSLAPFVLLPFLLASYDLPCSSDGFAAPHIHPIVSIFIVDLPWTCTLDMHLGHVPWTCTSAPWMPRAIPCATLGHACRTLDRYLGVQRWIRGHPWTHVVWRCQRGRVRGLSVGLVSGPGGHQ